MKRAVKKTDSRSAVALIVSKQELYHCKHGKLVYHNVPVLRTFKRAHIFAISFLFAQFHFNYSGVKLISIIKMIFNILSNCCYAIIDFRIKFHFLFIFSKINKTKPRCGERNHLMCG